MYQITPSSSDQTPQELDSKTNMGYGHLMYISIWDFSFDWVETMSCDVRIPSLVPHVVSYPGYWLSTSIMSATFCIQLPIECSIIDVCLSLLSMRLRIWFMIDVYGRTLVWIFVLGMISILLLITDPSDKQRNIIYNIFLLIKTVHFIMWWK